MSPVLTPERRRLGGRVSTVGGHDGSGPTVVLLGGCAVPHVMWTPVLEALAGRRVLWLDRPGMAGTRWPGRLPTLAEEAATIAELAAAEAAAGHGPVILVGHSMAGPHAEAAVRQYPQQVGGLVLIDSSVEWRAPVGAGRGAAWTRLARATRWLLGRRPVAGITQSVVGGLLRTPMAHGRGVTGAMADTLSEIWAEPDTDAMTVAEFGAYTAQITELYAVRARHAWPKIPTELLIAGRGASARWLGCQQRLARLLGGGCRTVDSGHNMMLGRADAIVGAVDRVSAPTAS